MLDHHADANRRNWDDRAALHATDTTGSYRIAKVLSGGSSLHQIEADEIGDVRDLDVVHLQCHIGLDTISLKHIGARSVTGIDFSPKAISAAREFAEKAGTPARFVEASVYDAEAALGERFDLVYVTWGALNWLADLPKWARTVAALLRPGGRLYLLEGHPMMNQMDWEHGRFVAVRDRLTPEADPLCFDNETTYTGDTRPIAHTRNYEWLHPISEVVGTLLSAELRLDFLHEHDRLAWRAFPGMVEVAEDLFAIAEGEVKIPLAFSLGATKLL